MFGQGIECGLGSIPASIINYRIGSKIPTGIAPCGWILLSAWPVPPTYTVRRSNIQVGGPSPLSDLPSRCRQQRGCRCEDRTWGDGASGESWMRGGFSAVSKAAFCRPPIGLPQFPPSTGEALAETAQSPGRRSSPDPIWGVTGCARLNAEGLGSVHDNSILLS